MSNYNNSTLYVGVTNDLAKRVAEHKSGIGAVFTSKYNCNKLVYFETFSDIEQAIFREKTIKGWRREKKNDLIDSINRERKDLSL